MDIFPRKIKILFFSILVLSNVYLPAFASQQLILGGVRVLIYADANYNTKYEPLMGGTAGIWNTNIAIQSQVMPINGTFTKLHFRLDDPIGGGDTITATITKESGTPGDALTCTLTDPETECTATGSMDVSIADLIALQVDTSLTSGGSVYASWYSIFVPDEEGKSIYMANTGSTSNGSTSPVYFSFVGKNNPATNISQNVLILTESGTVTNMFAYSNTPPGLGEEWTWELFENQVGTGEQCFTLGATVGLNKSFCRKSTNVTVTPGDYYNMERTHTSGVSPAASHVKTSIAFEADTVGNFTIPSTNPRAMIVAGGATQYNFLAGGLAIWFVAAQEDESDNVTDTVKLTSLFVLEQEPGGANSLDDVTETITFTVRADAADTNLSCTVTGLTQTCSDTDPSHMTTVTSGQLLGIEAATSVAVEADGSDDFRAYHSVGARLGPLRGAILKTD